MRDVALTIAGSDSGGGAGIQADLRVFARLGAFGTSAITAVTAQNLEGVSGVAGVDPGLVSAQMAAVLGGFEVRAAKTGMLWSAEIVEAVAAELTGADLPLVVDPVMVATSGDRLLDDGAVASYREALLPRAQLVTPNLDEAAVFLGRDAIADDDAADAADALYDRLGCPVLLKGGHRKGDPVDVLRTRSGRTAFGHRRIDGVSTHGSGCMLSAAITACLAGGDPLERACERGLAFVHDALSRALALAGGARLADIEAAEDDLDHLSRV